MVRTNTIFTAKRTIYIYVTDNIGNSMITGNVASLLVVPRNEYS